MANELEDGTSSGYEGFCPKCGAVIKTNIQGDEIGSHTCIENIVRREMTKVYNCGYNNCLEDLAEEDLLLDRKKTILKFWKNEQDKTTA